MSLIKRLSTTFMSSIDHLVGEIEDHDALINVEIAERKKRVAKARVQLSRLKDKQQQLASQIKEQQVKERQWQSRAVAEHGHSQEKALVCMQRLKAVQAKIDQLLSMQKDYVSASDKIGLNIEQCEKDLSMMMQKYELMRARQSSAEACSVVQQASLLGSNDYHQYFERWEVKLAETEISGADYDDSDELEKAYLNTEDKEDLLAALDCLVNKEKGDE